MSEDSRSQDLARRLWTALTIPVLVMFVTALALGVQLYRMSEDAHWTEHSERVLARAADVQRAIVDQESGLRGYLVTDDTTFLELYNLARPTEALRGLREAVADNPNQVARVDELTRRYEWWLADADVVAKSKITPEHRSTASMLARRARMQAVRTAAGEFIAEEQRLREIRKQQSAASETTTRWLVAGLFAFATITIGWVSRRQLTAIAGTYDAALAGERAARAETEEEAWIRSAQVALSERLQGDLSIDEIARRTLTLVAKQVGCEVGAFFTLEGARWKRRAALGLEAGTTTFDRGEGLVGRAGDGADVVHVHDVPANYLKVKSGTGEDKPRELVLVPARIDDVTFAVIEVAFLHQVEKRGLAFLSRSSELVAAAVRAAEQKARLRELLDESTRQGEELQAQQEELRVANEELAEQSHAVREANERLNERKHELEAINARLEEQQQELEAAQHDALQKANEVERASQYKSEFLANMSHELRTPLNSSLILAKLLSDNKSGNLTDEQVKFAQTIYAAGNDLLTLINDILDLSKIEAGKLDVEVAHAPVTRIVDGLTRTFEPIARERGIAFEVKVAPDAPSAIDTDAHRVDQILKNLLSNAFKFTTAGSVTLTVTPFGHGVRFAVTDTGVGIAKHQHGLVFEAFRQADSGEARRYGGTGLGLSISRDLARLLGGEIDLASELGRGSTFTLTLPARAPGHTPRLAPRTEPQPAPPPKPSKAPLAAFPDDRDAIDPVRRFILVIEDDVAFAKILYDLAHELSFQCIVAHEGEAGFALALDRTPSAIILDINLPDRSGLSLLDRFKRTPALRHVPVHVVSVAEHERTVLSMGAVGYLQKPVQREALAKAFAKIEERLDQRTRRLLIVEDDAVQRDSLTKLLGSPEIDITAVATVREALDALHAGTFDTVVTDLAMPDASGFDLLERMANDDAYAFPPTIVYTGRSLTAEEETRLRKYSSSIIVKGARSPERLVDEVTLFLHQVEAQLPPERQRMLAKARDRESVFEGRKVLVVEDDVRNVFALTSILEPKGAVVTIARNGREALDALAKDDGIDLVLMDIMMPEMDGLTAMREIRKKPEHAEVPIIALTAKAMRDDQEKCLQAGANDYIAKPLDVEMLLSLLRVWMPR